MKEAQNQIRFHRFIDSLDKKNNAKDIAKLDEQMKNLWLQRQSKIDLIIKIHELQVVFILLLIGLLLSFIVFLIENKIYTWTHIRKKLHFRECKINIRKSYGGFKMFLMFIGINTNCFD